MGIVNSELLLAVGPKTSAWNFHVQKIVQLLVLSSEMPQISMFTQLKHVYNRYNIVYVNVSFDKYTLCFNIES
jgi:hypothetical protein